MPYGLRPQHAALSAPQRPHSSPALWTGELAHGPIPLHALILEEDLTTRAAVVELVEKEGFETLECGSLAEARAALERQRIGLAVVDLELPDGSAVELLEPLNAAGVEVLVVTERSDVDTAVEALKMGVADFLIKPFRPPQLQKAIRDSRKTLLLRRDLDSLERQGPRPPGFAGMVGSSPEMQSVFELIEKVAPTITNVLVHGETGTGKELVAAAIHRLSERSGGPFVSVNCGALTDSLIESELFGHVAGAFTGARQAKAGVFEQASGGTLFLDEIFEMPLDQQVSLLRVLETRQVTRVGAEEPVAVDFRLIAATNRISHEAVEEGKVREDLLFRLMVFPIELPPLRDRLTDIPDLAQHFLQLLVALHGPHKRFTDAALDALASHTWPGNVRELRNVLERAYILADVLIEPEHIKLMDHELQPTDAVDALPVRVGMTIAQAEKVLIQATLEDCGGSKRKAAKRLGISLKTLYNRVNVYAAQDEAPTASSGA